VPGRQHISSGLIKRLCGALALVLALHGQAGANEPPRAVVERLNAALLDSMRGAAQLGYEGRYQLLEPVLRQSFDFSFMTRIAVGRAWSDFSAEDQARVASLFAKMSIANFAARFDGYSGERFEIVAEGPGPRDTVVVESRIVRPTEAPVGLNYVLKEFAEGWRIVDVLLDAKYSELAKQHAEFAAVLKGGGVPDLIASLEQKIKQLAGQT
jgi:phospholipid transport system substrate-binding protein